MRRVLFTARSEPAVDWSEIESRLQEISTPARSPDLPVEPSAPLANDPAVADDLPAASDPPEARDQPVSNSAGTARHTLEPIPPRRS